MSNDEKFDQELNEEVIKHTTDIHDMAFFINGADWGREYGIREVIEELRSLDADRQHSQDLRNNHLNPRQFSVGFPQQWADWLESRFAKEKE